MTLAEFRVSFPEFKNDADTLVSAKLAEAASQIDAAIVPNTGTVGSTPYDLAQGHLTAYLLRVKRGEIKKGEEGDRYHAVYRDTVRKYAAGHASS